MTIFDEVQYAIASALSSSDRQDISNLLNANGAVEVSIQQATHVITPTLEFEGARNTSESCVLVIPAWIERSQVLGKMQE
jgi:mediator of DNA damage checkpoint protein 1